MSAVEDRESKIGRMVVSMNASKNKGDQAEREAAMVLNALAADLMAGAARRKLGAGRRDDIGDLDAFVDVTIQVKAYADPVRALREAVNGAKEQANRSGTRWNVGMSPLPRARRDGVRWICSTDVWPSAPNVHLPSFGRTSRALEYIKSANVVIETPPRQRVALVEVKGTPTMFIGSIDAWVDALRVAYQLDLEMAG
jgi:hypothetical protein